MTARILLTILILITAVSCVALPAFAKASAGPRHSSPPQDGGVFWRRRTKLIQEARTRKLWERKDWLRLVHYRKTAFGTKSQADGPDFFLSGKEGKKNPQAELEATLNGFFQNAPSDDQQAQCRFPARYLWLKSELRWKDSWEPSVRCSRFKEFRKTTAAQSVTLVFSSYYLNNPASAFGHTFLRLNKLKTPQGERNELLDYGISYAAVVTTKNSLLYAFDGLFGFFKGEFSRVPFYYRVRQYNDYESRDLWEYDLSLSPEEVEKLVAHLWELGHTYFDYYYLTENCSYHLLSALEAAAPRLNLIQPLPFYVIPADTVKSVFSNPNLVSGIHYRPSARSQFFSRIKRLSDSEKTVLTQIISKPEKISLENLDRKKQVELLDTAIDYFDFRYVRPILKGEPKASHQKHQLLTARSRLAIPSPSFKTAPPMQEAPHGGHDPTRTGVRFGGSNQTGPFLAFSHRFALHDLLDPLQSYPDSLDIEFLSFEIRQNLQPLSTWLEDAALFRVISLSDFSRFNRSFSWKFQLGGSTFRDRDCPNCLAPLIEGGGGFSKKLGESHPVWLVLTVDGEAAGSPKFQGPDFRPRVGPTLLIRSIFLKNLQASMQGRYRLPLFPSHSTDFESMAQLRYGLTRKLAFDLQGNYRWKPEIWEGRAGILYYY